MTKPRILGIGAAHIDRRGRMAGPFVPGASNPGTMTEEAGGSVFNALRTLAGRGVKADIVAAIGGDAAGRQVTEAIDAAGIGDHCATFLDRATSSYTAILDNRGDLVAGLADMEIHETALPRIVRRKAVRELAAAADAILIDANLPPKAMAAVAGYAGARPLYAIAVSPAKVVRLTTIASCLSCLFMNRAEARALTGLPVETEAGALVSALRALGLARGCVTDGGRTLVAYDQSGILTLDPPRLATIADVTGAGDALAAAAIAALLHGKPFAEALREGTAAALCVLASRSAVSRMDNGAFAQNLAKVGNPRHLAGHEEPDAT